MLFTLTVYHAKAHMSIVFSRFFYTSYNIYNFYLYTTRIIVKNIKYIRKKLIIFELCVIIYFCRESAHYIFKGKFLIMNRLDAKMLGSMLIGATENLRRSSSEINNLNVFPVPDGDTGTNMTMTLEGGLAEIDRECDHAGQVIKDFAHGVLLGARGNSGVILSQIFAGIKNGLFDKADFSAIDIAEAYKLGVTKSYAAVKNPTEGTILTVFREATEYAASHINTDSTVEDFFKLHIEEARRSLARTKEILPVLMEADVVDSGGAGYLAIATGMYLALTGELDTSSPMVFSKEEKHKVDLDLFTRDSVLEFGYCTEFLLRLTTAKCNPDLFDITPLIDKLTEMGGESIVAYKDGDIVKVHVHTFTPGDVLSYCQSFGEFLTLKIENMSLDHTGDARGKDKEREKLSVITVASGEGMSALFYDMGATYVINGGQTLNPSTEDFINAFEKNCAEDIIVLPNNKNILLAANQAGEMYKEARVHIIPTKSMMQGYGAISVITPGITDIDVLCDNVTRAANDVLGCEVTRAVRDVTINGKSVKRGDYIAISDGEIVSVEDTKEAAVMSMLDSVDMDDYELITLFVGKGVTPGDRVHLTEAIEEEYPDCELTVYEGGQDVYYYLLALE